MKKASTSNHKTKPTNPTKPTKSTNPTRSTTTTTAPLADRTYAIGSVTQVFSEPGKFLTPPHSPNPTGSVVRTVSVNILYPVSGVPGSAPVVGARAAQGIRFPLVVFGPGYDIATASYQPVLDYWASHGFIVAAITFPLTNPGAPGGPYRPDIFNQPADMATVAQGVAGDNSNPSSPIYGVTNGSELALAGQSDGGDTVLALADNSYYHTSLPIKAQIILSGAEMHAYGGFPGTFFPGCQAAVPMLSFQGTADTINPPSYTNQYFGSAPEPKLLVCLLGDAHLPAYTQVNPWEQVVVSTSVAFLDAELYNSPGALATMDSAANANPSVANTASSCP